LIANFGERTPVSIAQVYAFRREPEKMFEWLDRAYERRQPNLPSIWRAGFTNRIIQIRA